MHSTKDDIFPPLAHTIETAVLTPRKAQQLYNSAGKDIESFWAEQASELLWTKPWRSVLQWKAPYAKWFVGGTLNVAVNCIDRHLTSWKANKAAIIWEGESGEIRTITYLQLHNEVNKFANVLQSLGVGSGDVVCIYLGMIPEAAVAMLACARIGATHNVVFGGFSSDALRDRINDSQAKVLITQDVAHRRGTLVELKSAADGALKNTPSIEHVVVVQKGTETIKLKAGRDHLYSELMAGATTTHKAKSFNSEHPLFILYTSGSTGQPKGILHTTGGYATQVAYTFKTVFDIRDTDVYFCTADIGWITGHSYIVYGPLMCGATILMYEGAPNHPAPNRFWEMIERHRVTVFYTAPTAIRSFMKWGEQYPRMHDLSSLRLLGTVGEPINPAAWMWYHSVIGNKKCPIVDTWWQTETGAIMIAPIPAFTPTKPGTATKPLPGIAIEVVRKDGSICKPNEGGLLVITQPWPSMLRTVYKNNQRYEQTYWAEFPKSKEHPGWYFTGDGARKDEMGNIWIMGRVDDVVNVSGHRLGTAEVESALVSHMSVAEAAVVAKPDEIKGSALVAFVTLKANAGTENLNKLKDELASHVSKQIGAIAKPDEIRFAEALPKTRSGKIMRRLLRELVGGATITGDTTTLEDFSVLEKLRANDEE